MLTTIYLYTWLATAAAFVLLFLAGDMTMNTIVIFGFIAFGMIFMGMIAVLPDIAAHPNKEIAPGASRVSVKPVMASIPHGAHSLRA
jgi:hypothetical protein